MLTTDMTIINNGIQTSRRNLFANKYHFLWYDQFMTWLPSLRNIIFRWQISSFMRCGRVKRKREREDEVDTYIKRRFT